MRLLILASLAFLLAGCFRSQTVESGRVSGSAYGQPIDVQWQRDGEGRSSLSIPPVVSAAADLLPSPWGTIAGGLLSALAGGGSIAALIQKRRADEHKLDAAEGWALAIPASTPPKG